MSTNVEQPGHPALVGLGHAVVLLAQSFTLLAYKRALTPLYSSVPASSYISYVSIVSAALGSVVEVPTSVAALAYGSLLAAAPNTVFYVGKYTARWKDPVLGPIATHAIVLVPILASGFALLQSFQVRARRNHMLVRLLIIPSPPAQGTSFFSINAPPLRVFHFPVARTSLELLDTIANHPCRGDRELRIFRMHHEAPIS
jgi:hypothetical protein